MTHEIEPMSSDNPVARRERGTPLGRAAAGIISQMRRDISVGFSGDSDSKTVDGYAVALKTALIAADECD